MIVQEQISDTLIRTYSDANVYIRGGNPVGDYIEAIDPVSTNRTYTETDILIDGRYIKELDDGRAYIGSSNQRLHYLSDRYKNIGESYYSSYKRRAEIKINPNEVVLVGVPSKNVLDVWQKLKEKSGGNTGEF